MGVEFADQSQTEGLGDVVMKRKRTLYAVAGCQLLVAGDFFQQESRQIRPSKEPAKMQFFGVRVRKQTTGLLRDARGSRLVFVPTARCAFAPG